MSRDFATLRAIASELASGHLGRRDAASQAVQVLIDRVHCSRVSLWAFDLQAQSRCLRCVALQRANEPLVADATLLHEDQYRDYFDVLMKSGVFVADDARSEPSLLAMRGAFLDQHRVGALLDVAVTVNGRVYGVVCCEQIPGPRQWSADDIAAARQLVSRAALLLACEPSLKIESIRSLPIAPLGAAGHADDVSARRRPNERRSRRLPGG